MVTVESINFVEGRRVLFSPCRKVYLTVFYLKRFEYDVTEWNGKNFAIRLWGAIEHKYYTFETIDECVKKANELLTVKNKK